jgi:hypothetical protein
LDASAVEDYGNENADPSALSQTRQQRVEAGTKVMADSFTVAVLPFSTDKDLVEKYKNPRGGLSESRGINAVVLSWPLTVLMNAI